MDDLIARLEQAEAGSRELDAEITRSIGWNRVEEGHPIGTVWYDKEGRQTGGLHPPRFTTSLDAAMTLKPDGYWYAHGREAGKPWVRCYDVERLYGSDESYGQLVEAATPALALCIAALRARGDT